MMVLLVATFLLFFTWSRGESANLPEQENGQLEHLRNIILLRHFNDKNNFNISSIDVLRDLKNTYISTTAPPILQSLNSNVPSKEIPNHLNAGNQEYLSRYAPFVKTVQIPVEVPKPYAVHVPHPVPVPVHIKVPVTVEKPYAVQVTKTVAIPVEKPVYIKVPHHIRVPVPQPYPVGVPQPVEVRVPYPIYIRVAGEPLSFGNPSGLNIANKVDSELQASNKKFETTVPAQIFADNLLNSYRSSRSGGVGSNFTKYQTAEYQKTW